MVRVIEPQDRGKNCPAAIFTPRQPDVSLGPLGTFLPNLLLLPDSFCGRVKNSFLWRGLLVRFHSLFLPVGVLGYYRRNDFTPLCKLISGIFWGASIFFSCFFFGKTQGRVPLTLQFLRFKFPRFFSDVPFFSLRSCRSSSVNFFKIFAGKFGKFGGIFLTHRIKAQKFRGKLRSIFRKKIRSSKKNLSCKIHSADVPP